MCSNILYKQDIESKKSERKALSIVDYKFSKNGKWIYRQTASQDYGIDCSLEYIDEKNEIHGDYFMCQVKGRTKLNVMKNNKFISFPIEVTTYNMAINNKTSFLFLLVDLTKEFIYFIVFNNYGHKSYNKEYVNIHIPIENCFPEAEHKLLSYLNN